MAGQRSVPHRLLVVLVGVLTLFAPSVPHAAAVSETGTPSILTPAAHRAHHQPVSYGVRYHRVLQDADPSLAGSSDDDAGDCPRDVERLRDEPSAPPVLARAATYDAIDVASVTVRPAGPVSAGDETPPATVHRCDPEGRGPPVRL